MARRRNSRKPSDQGVAKTLYLRRSVVRDAEREARADETSLSAFVEGAVLDKLEVRRLEKAARAAQAAA